MGEIKDLTKLARRALRGKRAHCRHNYQRPDRKGVEHCDKCDDTFPCRSQSDCFHVDCWTRRLELGIVKTYPIDKAVRGMTISDGRGGYVYDTTSDDPVDWTLPDSTTRVEDVI